MARFNGASVNTKGWPTPTTAIGQPKAKQYTGDTWTDLGLNPKLNLAQAAADFYLLVDLALDDEKAEADLQDVARYLAEQMARYVEIACAGEARYSSKASIHKVARNPQFKAFVEALAQLKPGGRMHVWANYDGLVRRFGKQTLLFLVLIFDKGKWGSSFGGKKWGVCAKTALAYRRGQMSALMFVDTAFGLTHNGNIVYDKLWSVNGLKKVLDYNQAGYMGKVAAHAHAQIRNRWTEARG